MGKVIELCSPASGHASLVAALDSGADAVYFGVKQLNMRMSAGNFSLIDLKDVVRICRKRGALAYLTLNTIVFDEEEKVLDKTLSAAKDAGVDAIICWDHMVLEKARRLGMRLHLSTQASVANFPSLLSYHKSFGVSRVVLARELSLLQISAIIRKIKKQKLDVSVETFVHGAMCVSVSGRCFLSEHLFGRSANRGDCLQPCRRSYIALDPEENNKIDVRDSFLLSPADLCCLQFIDKLIDSGINAFKIEGRGRPPEYVKTITSCYRRALDSHLQGRLTQELKDSLVSEAKTVYNRGFSTGFYLGRPLDQWCGSYGSKSTMEKHFVGKVANYYKRHGVAEIIVQSTPFCLKEKVMFQGKTTGVQEQAAESMQLDHKQITRAPKGKSVALKVGFQVRKGDSVYVLRPRLPS